MTIRKRLEALEGRAPHFLDSVALDFLGVFDLDDPDWEDVKLVGSDPTNDPRQLQRHKITGEFRAVFRDDYFPPGANLAYL